MTPPQTYKGPKVEYIHKEVKADPKVVSDQIVEALKGSQNLAVFTEDEVDGALTKEVLDQMAGKLGALQEGSRLFDQMQMIKTQPQLENSKPAKALLEMSYKEIINQIEEILDEDAQVKHNAIQKKIMDLVEQNSP